MHWKVQENGCSWRSHFFLYTCIEGLSIWHVSKHFQHSNDTISKYFLKMLAVFSHPPFYINNVCLPKSNDSIPDHIQKNPKMFPFFEGAMGALNGTHINCAPTSAEHQACWNWKGGVLRIAVLCIFLIFSFCTSTVGGRCQDMLSLIVTSWLCNKNWT